MAVWQFGGFFAEKEGCDDSFFFFSDPKANERVTQQAQEWPKSLPFDRRLVKVSLYP